MSDNAIWFVDGPAHPARMAREQSWGWSGGQTGVVGPESCEVVAQNVPTGSVRILPGMITMAATPALAAVGYTDAPYQSYSRALYESLDVPIDPTGSSGGRVDVVGIVVDDPEFEGTTVDPESHQYWRVHVVKNAGANAKYQSHFASLNRPFLPLAQVSIPANTAAVTNAMITDIRFMAVSRSHSVPLNGPANPTGGNLDIPPTQTGWVDVCEFSGIQVPQWATRAQVSMSISHLFAVGGRVGGLFRVAATGLNATVYTPASSFIESNDSSRFQVHTAGVMQLARATAGGSSRVRLQIQRVGTDRPGTVRIPDSAGHTSSAFGWITYEEAPRSAQS